MGLAHRKKKKPDHLLKSRYRKVDGQHEARVIVERRIGMKLPPTAIVHHVDPTDKLTNRGPFVVCPDQTYHGVIERRGRALRECGNANWRKCEKCGSWDDPDNLKITPRHDRPGQERVSHYRYKNECVNKGDPADLRPWPEPGTLCKAGAGARHLYRGPTRVMSEWAFRRTVDTLRRRHSHSFSQGEK